MNDKKADLAGPGIGSYEELEKILPQDYSSLLTVRETQQALLDDDPSLVNYLRGDSTYEVSESGTFRDRSSMLGDMIHSAPVSISVGGSDYVLAGANDGMLHVFDNSSNVDYFGKEVFAYVPNLVYGNRFAQFSIDRGRGGRIVHLDQTQR